MLHSGIDLHKKDLVIDTVDASGTALRRPRTWHWSNWPRSKPATIMGRVPGPGRSRQRMRSLRRASPFVWLVQERGTKRVTGVDQTPRHHFGMGNRGKTGLGFRRHPADECVEGSDRGGQSEHGEKDVELPRRITRQQGGSRSSQNPQQDRCRELPGTHRQQSTDAHEEQDGDEAPAEVLAPGILADHPRRCHRTRDSCEKLSQH